MQAGVDMWEAAGWLGMTVEQLEANYGHHHPDFQEDAAEAFGRPTLILRQKFRPNFVCDDIEFRLRPSP
jgi:hypothetical protein